MERMYSKMERKRKMVLAAIRLRKDDFAYSLSRELTSMALDYMSVRDETDEYEPNYALRKLIESMRELGLTSTAISKLIEGIK